MTKRLTADQVQNLATGTLQEWFTDYTPIDAELGLDRQYRVRLQDNGTYLMTPSQVEGDEDRPPQQFMIEVKVTEVPA